MRVLPVRLRTVATGTAVAVAVAGCGLGASALADRAAARDAFVSTMSGPKTVTVGLDAAFDADEVNQLAPLLGNGADDTLSDEESADVARFDDKAAAVKVVVSNGADRTGWFAVMLHDQPVFDMRYDASQAPADPTADTNPYPLSVAARFDPEVAAAFSAEVSPDDPLTAEEIVEPLTFVAQMSGQGLGPAMDALAAGEWVQVSGTFDRDAVIGGFAPTDDMFVVDRDALNDAVAGALTMSEPSDLGDGAARTVVDVDFGELVRNVLRLLAPPGEQDDGEATVDFFGGVTDLDVQVDDAIALTFDGDLLTEARIDLLDVGIQIGEETDDTDEFPGDGVAQIVDSWTTTRLDLVATVTDHGAVDGLFDVVEPTVTLDWSDLAAGASSLSTQPQGQWPVDPDNEVQVGSDATE